MPAIRQLLKMTFKYACTLILLLYLPDIGYTQSIQKRINNNAHLSDLLLQKTTHVKSIIFPAPVYKWNNQSKLQISASDTLIEVEPNNTIAQAQTLIGDSPILVKGTAEVDDEGDLVLVALNDDIEDLFSITTVRTGLSLSLSGIQEDCDLYIIDDVGSNVLGASNFISSTYPEFITLPNLAPGTYLIGVTIYDPDIASGSSTPYVLRVTTNCIPAPPDMVAWWPGDDNANERIANLHGTENGGTTYVNGIVDQAFSFDGIDDFVNTPLDVQPSAMPTTTWEAWIYPEKINHGVRQSIFCNDDGGFDRTVVIESNTKNFGIFTGTSVWQPVSADTGSWQHIAVIFKPDDIIFYKNGMQYNFGAAPSGQATIHPLFIGKNPDYGEYFQGAIDEVCIYDRALTAEEIRTIFTAGCQGKCKGDTVAIPTFNPVPGSYTSAQSVVISCATPGTTIYYTVNGADPSEADTPYATPVAISSTTTLKARAFLGGWTPSTMASGVYTISQTIATPTFNPVPGTYTSEQNVAISCATPGTAIYYTTNGTDPTEASTQYTSPIAISTTMTLKARAYLSGWNPSMVASGTYTIVLEPDISVNPGSLQFGSVAVGGQKDLTVRIGNDGDAPLSVTGLMSTHVDFTRTSSALPLTIAPDDSQEVTMRFSPASTGDKTGILNIISNDPDEATVQIPLSGTGESAASDTCITPPAKMVAWWPGDGDAVDYAGMYHGSLQNGIGFSEGYVREAFDLDGVDDYMSVNPELLNGESWVTIESWIYVNEYGTSTTPILVDATPDDMDFRFFLSDTHLLAFELTAWTTSAQVFSAMTIPQQTWTHVAAVYNAYEIKVFINGQQDGEAVRCWGSINSRSDDLRIGGDGADGTAYNGRIDELSLYYRNLSSNEIRDIYNAGDHGKCKPPMPDILIDTGALDFGTVALAGHAYQSLQVWNTGTGPLVLKWTVSTDSQFAAITPSFPVTLEPDSSFEIVVRFIPVIAGQQSADLTLESTDPDENTVILSLTGTGFGTGALTGIIGSYMDQTPVAGVRMTLDNTKQEVSITDSAGTFLFRHVNVGEDYTLIPSMPGYFFEPTERDYEPFNGEVDNADFSGSLYGDVSGNGDVMAYDASQVLQYSIGLKQWQNPDRDSIAADVSGNGRVNAFDASNILRHAAGLLALFPVEGAGIAKIMQNTDEVSMSFGKQYLDENGHIIIPVLLNGNIPIYSLEVDVSGGLQNSILSRVALVENFESYLLAYSGSDEKIRIAMAGVEPISCDGQILHLIFSPPAKSINEYNSPHLYLESVSLNDGGTPVQIDQSPLVLMKQPEHLKLYQNFPNPFNSSTVIRYFIPDKSCDEAGQIHVALKVYNLLGQEVYTIVDAIKSSGYYSAVWDGRESTGAAVSSGQFFMVLSVGNKRDLKKVLYIQ